MTSAITVSIVLFYLLRIYWNLHWIDIRCERESHTKVFGSMCMFRFIQNEFSFVKWIRIFFYIVENGVFVTKPIKRIVIKPVCYFSTDVAIWYKRIHSSWLGFAIRVESTHPLIQIYIYIYFMIWIKFLYDFRKIIKTRSNKNDFFCHFLTLSFRVRFKSSHKCRYRS